MRILHTSDWHLGLTRGPTSLGPDHEHFLDWLEVRLREGEVDTLVVAGDVFEHLQPSSEALQRYYRFLSRVGRTGVAQVVIVGGNHDSASRLDAPAEVLAALDVRVVGGIGGSESSWERCLVPLRRRSGEVGAVALAVPYVHEFRLGVRTTDLDRKAVRAAFTERFTDLYARLVDRARAAWPGLPVVATGHLTLGPAQRDDYPQEIHQVGLIDGLPHTILDPRIQYTALGHIHRSYPVDEGRRAWYSGCPVASSPAEARSARRVLRVDLHEDPEGLAEVTPLVVPAPRAVRELTGAPEALLAQVEALEWDEPLPPLLYCRTVADAMPSGLEDQLRRLIQAFPEGRRPTLVEHRQQRATPLPTADEAPARSLQEMSPADVFALLCEGRSDAEDLEAAFATLASAGPEDFQLMLEQVGEAT